jgi:sirohydrochlorin cobaltochelatase
MTALLLVGHGTPAYARASGRAHTGDVVRAHARRIRRTRRFDVVATAFYKEDPPLRGALDRIAADDVVVVPFFMAAGWYTNRIVPRELALDTARTGSVRCAEPVGAHPRMVDVVIARIEEARPPQQPVAQTTVIVAGHGTPRSATSGDTTHELATAVRERTGYADVRAAFLEQQPTIDEAIAAVTTNVIVVPFFAADGEHVRDDVATHAGRSVLVTRAVGTHPAITDMIIELAQWASST